MILGLAQDSVYQEHQTGEHPECPQRLAAIAERLADSGLVSETVEIPPRMATTEDLSRVHTLEYIEHVKKLCASGLPALDSGDTSICADSYRVALFAAGAGLEAADKIMEGHIGRAFAAVRPPGHHAEATRAMGFCLFNNVAVLARYLQHEQGLEKILVLDWDVHHGNGTQHAFEDDPSVYFISLHQWPFYPGTGAEWERGAGEGVGSTLNIPLPADTGDARFLKLFHDKAARAMDDFQPDFILISAGFDAHRADPLGGLRLTGEAYVEMTRTVADLSSSHCQGRIISLLEGGYDLDALADCVELHASELI